MLIENFTYFAAKIDKKLLVRLNKRRISTFDWLEATGNKEAWR
jgi:hypothetical protein